MWKLLALAWWLVLGLSQWPMVKALQCSRYPPNTLTPKSPVDENFVLSISNNAQHYILGHSYNITLEAFSGRRFMSAKIVLENSDGDRVYTQDLGELIVTDPVETRYSSNCSNMIETTNMNYKTRIDLAWVSPGTTGNGCVLIRATVLQHRDVWFMDDGALTKQVCEESVDDVQSQKRDEESKPCCACDEARYEIIFQGNWSRNLHPKDFPEKGFTVRFSEILGAAHTSDYRFWDAGELASPEMSEFAEHASTRGLEAELNNAFKEEKIRTILKARGPAYPFMKVPSLASVRVDPFRHQLSIASKIVPSPDWIVGISGLELCLRNCTWLEEMSVNLYPWDIGTDAGPSYNSPDQPQVPPDVIRRIRHDYPADIRSPFYDESETMQPMATLTVRRQRLYERKCLIEESNNPDDMARECRTHPWTDWSECSASCGPGTQTRVRVFKQPDVAEIYNCATIVELHQEQACVGQCQNAQYLPGAEDVGMGKFEMGRMMQPGAAAGPAADCRLGEWSEWSECNATCGAGLVMRQRELLDLNPDEACQDLEERFEYMPCFNRKCSGPNRMRIPIYDNVPQFNEDNNEGVDNQPEDNEMYNRNGNRQRGDYRPSSNGRNWPAGADRYDNDEMDPQDNRRYGKYANNEMDRQDIRRYGSNRQTEDYDRSSRPRNRGGFGGPGDFDRRYPSYNRYPDKTTDLDLDPSNPFEFNRQYNQYNNNPYDSTLDGENNERQRYRNGGNGENEDPIESLGEPYNFPAESLRKETSTEKTNTRRKGYFQYLNSPVQQDAMAATQTAADFCFQPLKITQCSDKRVIGNFWFYNHCRDECMLYAVDICDHNLNRFTSLEECEQKCATPARQYPTLLASKQSQAPECQRKRSLRLSQR